LSKNMGNVIVLYRLARYKGQETVERFTESSVVTVGVVWDVIGWKCKYFYDGLSRLRMCLSKEEESIRRDCTSSMTVPLQAWSGPEGSRKLRFPDFMTAAQDDGKVVSLTHRPPIPPGNAPSTHFC